MNTFVIFLSIGAFILFLSLIGIIVLWSRLKDLQKDEPHIIPVFLQVSAFFITLLHIAALIIIIGLIFFHEDMTLFIQSLNI